MRTALFSFSLLLLAPWALCAQAAVGPAPDSASSHLLDGKTFYGTAIRGSETGPENEIFVFRDGTFEAQWWQVAGMKPGRYKTRVEGKTIHFEADVRSDHPESGTIHWEGTVTGKELKITGIQKQPNQAPFKITGSGTLTHRPPA